ncbi:hypothetical protein ACA910_016682 [Epithemia clementina (nom. ined.)]
MESKTGGKNSAVSWFLPLTLPLWLVYISNQWSRSSIYYLVDFSNDAESFKAMNVDIGFSEAQYGLLASVAFTSLFAFASLGAGVAADRSNRKTLTIASALTWSVATLGTAVSQSYPQVVACRILMGLACAFSTPAAFTLIRDRAPPTRNALASSFYGTGVAVASALSSLSILLDNQLGWRNAYSVVGVYGIVALAVTAVLLEDDPKDSTSSQNATSTDATGDRLTENPTSSIWNDVKEVFSTRRVQLILIASLFRFSSGLMIGVWSGPYFRVAFADNQSEYAVAQAVISAVGASLSGLAGGATADWLVANASPDTKDPIGRRLWVVIAGSMLASPAWYFAMQPGQSFEGAMAWLAAEYVVAECWFGPTISTLQSTVGPKIGGIAQGTFTLTGATANIAPSVLGFLYSQTLEASDVSGAQLSSLLAPAVSTCYLISAVFFSFAARSPPPSSPAVEKSKPS